MLFINKSGQYVEILRKNYTSDIAYYTAIMKLKGYNVSQKENIELANIVPVNIVPLCLRIYNE